MEWFSDHTISARIGALKCILKEALSFGSEFVFAAEGTQTLGHKMADGHILLCCLAPRIGVDVVFHADGDVLHVCHPPSPMTEYVIIVNTGQMNYGGSSALPAI